MCWTTSCIWTANINIALAHGAKFAAALRTITWHYKCALCPIAAFKNWAKNLRDNISCFSKNYNIANQNPFSCYLLHIVKSGIAYTRARNSYRFHKCKWCYSPSSTNANSDIKKLGSYLLWRILISNSPFWCARGETKSSLSFSLIYLYYYAINFMLNSMAILQVILDKFFYLTLIFRHLKALTNWKPPTLH